VVVVRTQYDMYSTLATVFQTVSDLLFTDRVTVFTQIRPIYTETSVTQTIPVTIPFTTTSNATFKKFWL